MSSRTTAVLVALPALVLGLLVAAPAEAASYNAFVTTKNVAISTSGTGKVYVRCHSSRTCKGSLSFGGDTGTPRSRAFSVPAKQGRYVAVAMHSDASGNPHTAGATDRGDINTRSNVLLKVKETSPKRIQHTYRVTTETALAVQQIRGTVSGPGTVTDRRVELIRVLRGGNTDVVRFDDDLSDGYRFTVKLGVNNSSSSTFRLRVSARDQDGVFRAWFWRGSDNSFAGGGRYLREASPVRATKYGDFEADVRYGSISGDAPTGAQITVATRPSSYAGGAAVRRELDLPGCANVLGETRARSGRYRVDFLPVTSSKRYMVSGTYDGNTVWNNTFGSCFDVINYQDYSTTNLLSLPGSTREYDVAIGPSRNSLAVDAAFSGFTATSQGDRWIRVREKVPGLPILDAPVVAEGLATRAGTRTFTNVRPGKYWVEVGRRTGCSDWYKSVYPNNAAYFKGGDRSAEKWKAFTRLGALSSGPRRIALNVKPNPATTKEQGRVPSGHRGWMYRGHCKALGAGRYVTTNVSGLNRGTITVKPASVKKGAVVAGRVIRTGGRTNKEMMVRLSSSDGVRVLRTDLTDSKGRFYVAGLPSGRWTISVNSDSWRGIGRSFTGKHSITVRAGKTYRAGTLRFRG